MMLEDNSLRSEPAQVIHRVTQWEWEGLATPDPFFMTAALPVAPARVTQRSPCRALPTATTFRHGRGWREHMM